MTFTEDTEQLFGRNTRVKIFGGELTVSFSREEGGFRFVDYSQMIERGRSFQPVFEAFRPIWYEHTRRVFALEGYPEPWPPLSQHYANWKRNKYPGKGILRRSDRLYRSLLGGPGGIYRATPRTIQYGTTVPYSDVHQEGWQSIPQRPHITMDEGLFQNLADRCFRWITTGKL